MVPLKSLCVYCGSSNRIAHVYREAAAELGRTVAEAGIRLVFGGGRVGLMGVVADAALAAGGHVIGVVPRHLQDLEVAHEGVTELRIVDSMHTRKRMMFDLADAFVALPGGFGTLDEMFEIITWRQLRLHEKPLVLVDVAGYWGPLRAMVEEIVTQGFARPEHGAMLTVVESVGDVLPMLGALPSPRLRPRVQLG
ncbi:MAG: TIGR00730 family Rossman fold protein [Alphaproteobacteria bacterium]|nr:TIGR00730 family Rossman fold protein [Alphaproteobacteria bacterium]